MRRLKTANVWSERQGYCFRQGAELTIWNPAAISSTNIPSGQWIQVDGIWTSVAVGEGIGIGEEIVIEGERSAIQRADWGYWRQELGMLREGITII